MPFLIPEVDKLIDQALVEDQVINDPTTAHIIDPYLTGSGLIVAKAHGILAGIEVSTRVFQRVGNLHAHLFFQDGTYIAPGDTLAKVEGTIADILRAERTALNFVQRMSGIATETSYYVKAVEKFKATIIDTRKTVPGWRYLDKYSVRTGGGRNHRMNLVDGILIKDNHLTVLNSQGFSLEQAVKLAIQKAPHTIKVEVEVTTIEEVVEALNAEAHIIMLDNMTVELMRQAVKLVDGKALIEASGGITLQTVKAVAETGVDLISVGSLTHSPKALDISLDIDL